MSKLAMCRVCLAVDVRMFTIINTPLQEIYEKITNTPLSHEKKSYAVCYVCHSHFRKSFNLMTRAVTADQILTQMLQSGLDLTHPPLVDRQSCDLADQYCISPIEHFSTILPDSDTIETYNESNKVKPEDAFVCKVEKDEKVVEKICEENYDDVAGGNHETSNTDSEDDIPLQTISNKNKVDLKKTKPNVSVKKKNKVHQGKIETGFIADFAEEIILTKEQQLRELQARASSLNYLNSPLKCTLCYKGFVDARAYENHTAKHNQKSGPHECEICRMRYSTHRQLRTHAHTSHSHRYQCLKCSHQSHTANQAREHEKWHSGYTYECKLCGQTFRKPTSYLTHMRKRHPTQHVCNICGDSFVGRHGLLMHKSKTHRDDKLPEDPSEPPSVRFCTECNIEFASRDAWKRHILSSAKHTLLKEHSPQCEICGTRFPSSSGLQSHLREHQRSLRASRSAPLTCTPTADLACDQCECHFVNRSKLQAHVKRKHLGLKYNKNIVCEVCGKKCTSNASLKYHQRTHTGEKPYQCKECPRRFADNNQLRIHTRTHTGERPYCCALCGKRFSQKPALTRHYRVHTGAKPYICQFCSKSFSQSNSLKLHVQTVHLKMPSKRKQPTETKNIASVGQ